MKASSSIMALCDYMKSGSEHLPAATVLIVFKSPPIIHEANVYYVLFCFRLI